MGARSSILALLGSLFSTDGSNNILLSSSPPAYDNSLKLPSTSWVQTNLGNFNRSSGGIGVQQSMTLARGNAGFWAQIETPGITLTLPSSASTRAGDAFWIMCSNSCTIAADKGLVQPNGTVTNAYSALQGETICVVDNGNGYWYMIIDAVPGGGIINNTNATSDISLAVGQSAYVAFTSATSIPLHIATAEGQMYEIDFMGLGNTTTSTAWSYLLPNNATYANFFQLQYFNVQGGTGYAVGSYQSAFPFGRDVRTARVQCSIKQACKSITYLSHNYLSSTIDIDVGGVTWVATAGNSNSPDSTYAWTSLGTLSLVSANTGVAVVRRLA